MTCQIRSSVSSLQWLYANWVGRVFLPQNHNSSIITQSCTVESLQLNCRLYSLIDYIHIKKFEQRILVDYSRVPIRRHGTFIRHTSFIRPNTFPKKWAVPYNWISMSNWSTFRYKFVSINLHLWIVLDSRHQSLLIETYMKQVVTRALYLEQYAK